MFVKYVLICTLFATSVRVQNATVLIHRIREILAQTCGFMFQLSNRNIDTFPQSQAKFSL